MLSNYILYNEKNRFTGVRLQTKGPDPDNPNRKDPNLSGFRTRNTSVQERFKL